MSAFDYGVQSGKLDVPLKPDMLPQYTTRTGLLNESLKKEHIIQPFVYRFLQFTGLYPRCVPNDVDAAAINSGPRKIPYKFPVKTGPLIATICVPALTTLGSVPIMIDYWITHKVQMEKLEFFGLINFIFTLSEFMQAIVIFLLLVWNSDKLIPLVAAIEDYLNKVILILILRKPALIH
jgi:hypothetical protein